MNQTYPPEHHPVFFLRDALRDLGADAEFNGRDARTLGCWGLVINGKPMVWLIDNRHAHEAAQEDPAAKELLARGVLVCHAQQEDCQRVGGKWLALAATPSMLPRATELPKTHDAAFVGYVRDHGRANVLAHLGAFCKLNVQQKVFGQAAQEVYRGALCGLNVTTRYGQPEAYDSANMRFFEVMACGVPVLTPESPTLAALGFVEGKHGYAYRDPDHLCDLVRLLMEAPNLAAFMGANARKLATERHLYMHRAEQVLEWLR